VARYDGYADWYDETHGDASEWMQRVRDCVRELLGPGDGRLLDLGCGGGARTPLLQELGWQVVGVDVSADQLRVARGRLRGVELVQADAADLPFADASFDAVTALTVHTDLDDYASAVAEAARVLRPGGAYVHAGLHPCFFGHFSEPHGEGRLLRPGYRETGLSYRGWDPAGVRARVGARHVPLANLLNGILDSGLTLERVLESEGEPPSLLAFRARR
jgi:SAM-dependent methyltransferase